MEFSQYRREISPIAWCISKILMVEETNSFLPAADFYVHEL